MDDVAQVYSIKLNGNKVTPPAFSALIRYMYSDVLEYAAEDTEAVKHVFAMFGLPEMVKVMDTEQFLKASKPTLKKRKQRRGGVTVRAYPLGPERMAKEFGSAFFLGAYLSDFSFRSDTGAIFNIHKAVVCTRSSYFETLLSPTNLRNFKDASLIHDFPSHVIMAALLFLYTGGDDLDEILFPSSSCSVTKLSSNETALEKLDPAQSEEGMMAEIATLERLLEMGTLYMMWGLCAIIPDVAFRRKLLVAKTVFLWLSTAETFNSASLRSKCMQVLGESLAMHFVYDQPLTIDLESFEDFLREQTGASGGQDREYYVAEVREAFIETIPFSFPMQKRDEISDAFEAQFGRSPQAR
jgi:hypothetical protein